MKLPNFIIAGFPKCGTTSLYHYLSEHPEIYMPKQKELHYFTYPIISAIINGPGDKEANKFHIDNFKDYKNCYKQVSEEIAVGDTSPSYINHPSCIPKIKTTLGDNTKVIVLVRDPIKRAYSNYLHLKRENRESLTFYEALQAEARRKKEGYADFWYYTFNSSYYEKIRTFKEEFNSVFVITTEELSKNPEAILRKTFRYLEVDETYKPQNIGKTYNPGGVYKSNFLTNLIFEQNKIRGFVKKTIPITPGMKHLKHRIISRYKKITPPIDEQAELYLSDVFIDEVRKLRQEFGIDTSSWNKNFD